MARAIQQGRQRTLALAPEPASVVASLPSRCALCGGAGVVQLVWLSGFTGGGPMACPHHCAPHLEIRTYPRFRRDHPSGDAA